MENKPTTKKQKDEYTHIPTVPGGTLCGSQERAPLRKAADAARYARARKNATN